MRFFELEHDYNFRYNDNFIICHDWVKDYFDIPKDKQLYLVLSDKPFTQSYKTKMGRRGNIYIAGRKVLLSSGKWSKLHSTYDQLDDSILSNFKDPDIIYMGIYYDN